MVISIFTDAHQLWIFSHIFRKKWNCIFFSVTKLQKLSPNVSAHRDDNNRGMDSIILKVSMIVLVQIIL